VVVLFVVEIVKFLPLNVHRQLDLSLSFELLVLLVHLDLAHQVMRFLLRQLNGAALLQLERPPLYVSFEVQTELFLSVLHFLPQLELQQAGVELVWG